MSMHATFQPTDSIVAMVAATRQSEVDLMMAEVRAELAATPFAGSAAPVPTASADADDASANLTRAIALLEALEDALCDDPAVLAAHAERLQNLDAALQYLRAAESALGRG